ncbi:AP-2 complex subunit alpha [Entamoeba marina]
MELSRTTLRGLNNFIQQIHRSTSQEAERKEVNKELAHIRMEFKTGKKLKGHGRRKYILKLLYIYVLGYEVDFGIPVITELLTSVKFRDKQVGYLSLSLLLYEQHEATRLVINTLRTDLIDVNPLNQCCALNVISCIGGKEMVETLGGEILNILFSNSTQTVVRKKAALALKHLYKKNPSIIQLDQKFHEKMVRLLNGSDLCLVSCVIQFLTLIVEKNHRRMARYYSVEYNYHSVPSPWLQVRILRILRYIPPKKGPEENYLIDCINTIIEMCEAKFSENTKNAMFSILFEIIELASLLDIPDKTKSKIVHLLGSYLSASETNIRYLALDAMCSMCAMINSLKEIDISVKRRALQVLFDVCDTESISKILGELLRFLPVCDLSIREEVIVKICFLAEKFAKTPQWYVDIMLQLTAVAGDYISDTLLNRILRIIINNENVQVFAAKATYKYIQEVKWRDAFIKLSSYILGEYGFLIVKDNMKIAQNIFTILYEKFPLATTKTKLIMLTAFAKLHSTFPCLRDQIQSVFIKYQQSWEPEICDRSQNYLFLTSTEELANIVFEAIPPWEDAEENVIGGDVTVTENTEDVRNRNTKENTKDDDLFLLLGVSDANKQNPPPTDDLFSILTGPIPQQQPPQEPQQNNQTSQHSNEVFSFDEGPSFVEKEKEKEKELSPSQNTETYDGCLTLNVDNQMKTVLEENHGKLILAFEGVLYQDEAIQIGLKSSLESPTARLALFFGNRLDENVTITHKIKCPNGLTLSSGDYSGVIAAKSQTQSVCEFAVAGFYYQSPVINITYSTPSIQNTIAFTLPLSMNAFLTQKPLDPGVFMQYWNTIGGATERKTILDMKQNVDLVMVLGGLRFVCLDVKPEQIVACSCFPAFQDIFVLLRIEINTSTNQVCIYVRAHDPTLAEVIHNLLCYEIGK